MGVGLQQGLARLHRGLSLCKVQEIPWGWGPSNSPTAHPRQIPPSLPSNSPASDAVEEKRVSMKHLHPGPLENN